MRQIDNLDYFRILLLLIHHSDRPKVCGKVIMYMRMCSKMLHAGWLVASLRITIFVAIICRATLRIASAFLF